MKLVEVTWKRVIKVWWSFIWRGTLFGFIGGFIVGFIIGLIAGVAGGDSNTIGRLAQIGGGIIGIPIGIVVMRIVLRKQYSDFRIALIAK
jgi:hypothetical protein